jgi:hypothetical protein
MKLLFLVFSQLSLSLSPSLSLLYILKMNLCDDATKGGEIPLPIPLASFPYIAMTEKGESWT